MSLYQDYLALITVQYQNSPKFMEWINSLIDMIEDVVDVSDSITTSFDVDSAVGPQLDTLGKIIGVSRNLPIPIEGGFFSWYDGTADTEFLGWEAASWRGPNDVGGISMNELPDDAYRQILKFKIVQNDWDGSADDLYRAWETVFADDDLELKIEDGQDMSVAYTITGSLIPATVQAVISQNYVPMKPAGVSVSYSFVTVKKSGTIPAMEARIDITDGSPSNAFFAPKDVDLSLYQDGRNQLRIYQSGVLVAQAWISTDTPGGFSYGDELINYPYFSSPDGWVVSNWSVQVIPGVISYAQIGGSPGYIYRGDVANVVGALYMQSTQVIGTGGGTITQTADRVAGINGVPIDSPDEMSYMMYSTAIKTDPQVGLINTATSGISFYLSQKRALDCNVEGVYLLSTQGGDRGFVYLGDIDPNAEMDYEIVVIEEA